MPLVKHTVNIEDLDMLNPTLYPVIGFLMMFCFEHNLECLITSAYRANDPGPHGDFRAVDFRANTWPEHHVEKFRREATEKYGHLGAYSRSDGKQRLVIFHGEGLNYHGHIQCK